MKLKNFKKKTSNEKKESIITEYNLENVFEYLKVIKVINYYTLEVIVYNNGAFNRWKFILSGVSTFDDRLTTANRDKFKVFVESMVKDKYYMFNVTDMINSTLEGKIFLEENINKSLNTMLSNNIINCLILKDKIRKLNRKHTFEEAKIFNKLPSKLSTHYKLSTHSKLNDIYENQI